MDGWMDLVTQITDQNGNSSVMCQVGKKISSMKSYIALISARQLMILYVKCDNNVWLPYLTVTN